MLVVSAVPSYLVLGESFFSIISFKRNTFLRTFTSLPCLNKLNKLLSSYRLVEGVY